MSSAVRTPSTTAAGAAALDGDRGFMGHPRGLPLLFLVEMWERFSYYGMRGLLVLYLVNSLRWSDADAANLYGTYTGLVYLTPLLGGWLADRWLGTRRSLVIGGSVIAAGHFALALPSMASFYVGLGLIIVGTGFFKPNVSTMVGQLYAEGDPRRDSGFTLFYIGINLGSFLAALVCGGVAQQFGWHAGFASAGIGMLLGLCVYLWGRGRYLAGIGLAPTRAAQGARAETAAREAGAGDWRRVAALLVVFLFVIAFWAGFEQAGSSMNLFADRHTDRALGGFQIPTTWFQAINAFAILLFAPLFAWMWAALARRGREPSTPAKMVLGLVLLGLGFAFLAVGGRISDGGVRVSPVWLLGAYTLHTWGELCLSPVGLSYVTKVAPARFASLLMAAWFLANSAGNKIAGSAAAQSATMPSGTFFSIFVVSSLGAAALLFFLVPVINRLSTSEPRPAPLATMNLAENG
ncbi:MAG TPA: peptide MFS transporter [Longimicrobiaceae bacterium]|nr:peptide MFS transporter [Longimicrobiaceae bacterium]